MAEDDRAAQHCGWIDRRQWPPGAADLPPYPIGGELVVPEVCPGWLHRQPLVSEIAQAWRAFDKGQMGDVFPDAANVVVEGVFVMDAAVQQHEAERRKSQQRTPTDE